MYSVGNSFLKSPFLVLISTSCEAELFSLRIIAHIAKAAMATFIGKVKIFIKSCDVILCNIILCNIMLYTTRTKVRAESCTI